MNESIISAKTCLNLSLRPVGFTHVTAHVTVKIFRKFTTRKVYACLLSKIFRIITTRKVYTCLRSKIFRINYSALPLYSNHDL